MIKSLTINCFSCSRSMSWESDFLELVNTDDNLSLESDEVEAPASNAVDGSTFLCASLDEMKSKCP